MFFDFIGILPGETMIERSKDFCDRSRSNNGWAFSCILQYSNTSGNSRDKGNKRMNHEESISGRKVVLGYDRYSHLMEKK